MSAIARLDAAPLEALCMTLADTSEGLTGGEIGTLLTECSLDDPGGGITKWRRMLEPHNVQQRKDGHALTYDVEVRKLEGVDVRITSREKTVADCFKYRNKIGLDVALEALREYLRSRKRSIDQLNKAAEACRVARVMRPYLEALA